MDWQPIETAPKDGTRVRIRFADGHEDERYWKNSGGRGWCKNVGWPVAYNYRLVEPTHWLPLPPPPYATKADSDGDDGA